MPPETWNANVVHLTAAELAALLAGTADDATKAKATPADDGSGIIIIVRP